MPRSDPLIIDKETGEPRELLWVQTKNDPWKLIVFDRTKRKRKEKLYASYREAKEKEEAVKEKYGDRVETRVVSRQVGYGPPESKVTDYQIIRQNQQRKYWCPYCRLFRKFLNFRGAKRCEFCHTRITDYHVIRCNPVFWTDKEDI